MGVIIADAGVKKRVRTGSDGGVTEGINVWGLWRGSVVILPVILMANLSVDVNKESFSASGLCMNMRGF